MRAIYTLLVLPLVLIPSSVFAQVLITEVEYNAEEETRNQGEWLELYNESGTSIDISGWTIQDEGAGYGVFQFPENSIIPAFTPILLVNELDGFQLEHGAIIPDFIMVGDQCIEKSTSTRCMQMHNSQPDSLTLKNDLGAIQDRIDWAPPTSGDGKSICRDFSGQSFIDTNSASDWLSECTPSPKSLPFVAPTPTPTPTPIPTPISSPTSPALSSATSLSTSTSNRGRGGQNALIVQQLRESGTAYQRENTPSKTETPPLPSNETQCTPEKLERYPENRGSIAREQHQHLPESFLDLWEQEIITGTETALYRPISRAEFVKIMAIAREDTISCDSKKSFPDVYEQHWYFEIVHVMEQANIVHGYADGNYYPHRHISLAELYKIVSIGFGFITHEEATQTATTNSVEWFEPYRYELGKRKLIEPSLFFSNPEKAVSRAEAFEVISTVLKYTDKNRK